MTKRKKVNPRKTDAISDTRASEKTIAQSTLNLQYAFDRDVDFKSRVIRISEEIDAGVFDKIDAAMNHLERSCRKMITIKINSEGGSVYDALAIVGRLTSSKCKIVTEGHGRVMSAATLILACGDERKMSKYCWLARRSNFAKYSARCALKWTRYSIWHQPIPQNWHRPSRPVRNCP